MVAVLIVMAEANEGRLVPVSVVVVAEDGQRVEPCVVPNDKLKRTQHA